MYSKQTAEGVSLSELSACTLRNRCSVQGLWPLCKQQEGEWGFCAGPSDETLLCCIYRRTSCIFNAEEGMGPLETFLLRHCCYTQRLKSISGVWSVRGCRARKRLWYMWHRGCVRSQILCLCVCVSRDVISVEYHWHLVHLVCLAQWNLLLTSAVTEVKQSADELHNP